MNTLISKLKTKYTPVIPANQLPDCIYRTMISTLLLIIFSLIFMIIAFLISFEFLYLIVGIPIILILFVTFFSWIADYLYGKILVVDGVITEFSNTDKDKQNILQRKIVSRYIRSTFSFKLLDNTEIHVVCPHNMKYKVGQTLRLYYTQEHLIQNNGVFLLNQVSHIERLSV